VSWGGGDVHRGWQVDTGLTGDPYSSELGDESQIGLSRTSQMILDISLFRD